MKAKLNNLIYKYQNEYEELKKKSGAATLTETVRRGMLSRIISDLQNLKKEKAE